MTGTAKAPVPHGIMLLVTSAFLPKPEMPTDSEQIPTQRCIPGQVNFRANRLSCLELVMLVYTTCYISSPSLKHHTQRLWWQGACLPQICFLRSIGTLVRLKHQLCLTSKACPAKDRDTARKQYSPDTWEEREAFWTPWYLFISHPHDSGSKVVTRPALKQSKRQTTTPLFHTNMWECPKPASNMESTC